MGKRTKMVYDKDYNKEYDTVQAVTAVATLAGSSLGLVGKGIAGINQGRAVRILQQGQQEYLVACNSCNRILNNTQQLIRYVVSLKKQIMKDQMTDFLRAYKRLNPKISFKNSDGLNELERFIPDKQELKDLHLSSKVYIRYNESDSSASKEALVMVQDGTVERISDHVKRIRQAEQIKDKDLKRATLDELKVEGIDLLAQFSTVAIEFAVEGITDAVSSIRKVNEAKRYAAEYHRCAEQLKLKETKLGAIEQYATIHMNLLEKYIKVLRVYIPRTVKIIREKDNLFHIGRIKQEKFTQDELKEMAFTFSLVGAVKAIIDSPIIAQNGEVYTEYNPGFENARDSLLTFEQRLALPE